MKTTTKAITKYLYAASILLPILVGCGNGETNTYLDPVTVDLREDHLANKTAYIPPMCYTKTVSETGMSHNPCYACHTQSTAPNYRNDQAFQMLYTFPEAGNDNPWKNLFTDKQEFISTISDADIDAYVAHSNYFDDNGSIILANTLNHLPKAWDVLDRGTWLGYIPDCYFNFDAMGFDRNPDGNITGWRAFLYTPFLGTFWPTNGSTDDVMIRLPDLFRMDASGQTDLEFYRANLGIIQAMIQEQNVTINDINESKINLDLDADGVLGTAHTIVYDPGYLHCVGKAYQSQKQARIHLVPGLFPEGTEFLHTVRYLDASGEGAVHMSQRMKEVRYARKTYWYPPQSLKSMAENDKAEDAAYPNQTMTFSGNVEIGLDNHQGWYYQGFIEDKNGDLRPQSLEETYYCMGCHTKLGATTDNVFAFPRKVAGTPSNQFGWIHATQFHGTLSEPKRKDGAYEYTYYLNANHAGDEFRGNTEVIARFFDDEKQLKPSMAEKLHKDISTLILPSKDRARLMDKAYYKIVREQSFLYGRDATVTPVNNVHKRVEQDQPTGVESTLKAQ